MTVLFGSQHGTAAAAQGLAGHWSAAGEQLHCASLVWYIPLPLFSLLFLSSQIAFISAHEFYLFSHSLPNPLWGSE